MKRKKASTKIAIFHGFICVKNTDPDMATIRMQSATAHRKICVRTAQHSTEKRKKNKVFLHHGSGFAAAGRSLQRVTIYGQNKQWVASDCYCSQ